MQNRPDAPALLDGVTQFLMAEVLPKIGDKALAFRVMIAANLSTVVAAQLRAQAERSAAEAARLKALVPDDPTDAGLVGRIRARGFEREVLAHLKQSALEALALVNPRFDTSAEIE